MITVKIDISTDDMFSVILKAESIEDNEKLLKLRKLFPDPGIPDKKITVSASIDSYDYRYPHTLDLSFITRPI